MKELTERLLTKINNNTANALTWHNITYNYKLTEDFIRQYQDKVFWDIVSVRQKLSEDFIREFQDAVSWYDILRSQKLSENFIIEFQDKVDSMDWKMISQNYKLSEKFIIEFQGKIDFDHLILNKRLSKAFKKYNNKTQDLILSKIIGGMTEQCYFYQFMTDYMKEKFKRLSIML